MKPLPHFRILFVSRFALVLALRACVYVFVLCLAPRYKSVCSAGYPRLVRRSFFFSKSVSSECKNREEQPVTSHENTPASRPFLS